MKKMIALLAFSAFTIACDTKPVEEKAKTPEETKALDAGVEKEDALLTK